MIPKLCGLLESGADVNAQDKDLASPLHLASSRASSDIMWSGVALVLLDNGAEVNAVNIHGQNSLHILVLHTSDAFNLGEGLARLLLDRGVNLNGRDKDEITPLHLTLRRLLPDMAQFLLENEADVNTKNSRGKYPLQFASGRKRKEMKRLLLEYSSEHDTVT